MALTRSTLGCGCAEAPGPAGGPPSLCWSGYDHEAREVVVPPGEVGIPIPETMLCEWGHRRDDISGGANAFPGLRIVIEILGQVTLAWRMRVGGTVGDPTDGQIVASGSFAGPTGEIAKCEAAAPLAIPGLPDCTTVKVTFRVEEGAAAGYTVRMRGVMASLREA